MSNLIPRSTLDHRKQKGRALARLDREQKMLSSGTLGTQRLLMNIALDYMEKHPAMNWEQALFAAQAYCDRAHS